MNLETQYGFQAHLSSEFPSQIVVDVTEYCNLACVHCPHNDFIHTEAFSGRHLDYNLHKKLVDEVARDGKGICKYLRYTALGEPLLHPQFVSMIDYAGKYSETIINVTTNGKALTKNKAKALLDAGVGVFDISIDAYKPETYAKIRKKGDLNATRANVLKLIELIQKKTYQAKVVVSFIVQPLNMQETADFEKFWNNAGANYVVIRRLHSWAGAKEDVVKQIKQQNHDRYPCLYPWERLTLNPKGEIDFCPTDCKYQSAVTSFENTTIKEIWQGEFMQKLREAHLKNNFSHYSVCGQCPDWSATRWPGEGRVYSNMMQEFMLDD